MTDQNQEDGESTHPEKTQIMDTNYQSKENTQNLQQIQSMPGVFQHFLNQENPRTRTKHTMQKDLGILVELFPSNYQLKRKFI